jgi:hypothetical protein
MAAPTALTVYGARTDRHHSPCGVNHSPIPLCASAQNTLWRIPLLDLASVIAESYSAELFFSICCVLNTRGQPTSHENVAALRVSISRYNWRPKMSVVCIACHQGCGSGSGSVLDPDSVTLCIRIRIGNPDPDPDPGARK